MKRIIISCILYSLVAFTFVGCDGVHVSFDSSDKAAQEEVKQEQSVENKPVAAGDEISQEEAKQDKNTEGKATVNVNINEVPQRYNKPNVVIIKEPSQTAVYNGSFVFWNSDCAYLTQSQVASLTNYELGIARNEIYARHGYIFSTEKYKTYFNAQSWYSPTTKNVTLNNIETYNVSLIKAEEDRRGIKN